MNESGMEMFDGEFIHITAGDVRYADVILGDARMVTATPEPAADGHVTITTVTGPETYPADTPIHVFRPAPGCAGQPCPDCGAAPGEPCDWDCLGYAALDDAVAIA